MVEPDDSLKRVSFVNFPDEERTSAFLIPWIPAGHRLANTQSARPQQGRGNVGERASGTTIMRVSPRSCCDRCSASEGTDGKIANTFRLRLLSFLVYDLNESFTEALVGTRNFEDLGIAFWGESLFRKCPLHL